MKSKKAQVFDNLAGLAVGIATFAIIIVVAFLIMANVKTQLQTSGACANTTDVYAANGTCLDSGLTINRPYSLAWNSTNSLQNTTSTVPGWIPLVVIVSIGALILGMIGMFRR